LSGDDNAHVDHPLGLVLLSLPIALLVGVKLGSDKADAASAAAADHFLIGKLTARSGISASSARTAENTTPATTAM
jgi:hypothetical protein